MDAEHKAMERLRAASDMSLRMYQQPLVITYSGGKDSAVLLALAERSGIPFEVIHSLTTADAPQTVYHVRSEFHRLESKGGKCAVDKHIQPDGSRITLWSLIVKNGVPTRLRRFCCRYLKEADGRNRFIATGVRWEESSARKKNRSGLEIVTRQKKDHLLLSMENGADRQTFEACRMRGKRVVNPIIDWTTEQVWDYCRAEHLPMNPLYQRGFSRVGCVGCPLAGRNKMQFEFQMFPTYKAAYIRAFDRMLEARREKGLPTRWESGVDVFHWWIEDGVLPGQTWLDGFGEEEE